MNPVTTTVKIDYVSDRKAEQLSHGEVCDRLERAWQRDKFERFVGTPLDVDAGTENPYWDIVRLMKRDTDPWSDPWALDWIQDERPLRKSMNMTYAWSIPSPADLLWMRGILAGRGVVEVGAGSGYWAWQLSQLGIDIEAYDDGSWNFHARWFDVQDDDARAGHESQGRALLLVWPTYGTTMANDALDAYDGDLLLFAGEGHGGCTGEDSFHDELERSWEVVSEAPHHPTFEGIHCRLTAYRRVTR